MHNILDKFDFGQVRLLTAELAALEYHIDF